MKKAGVFIVCGGRDFADYPLLKKVLDEYRAEFGIFKVIEGDASGADKLAAKWCFQKGLSYYAVPAMWHKHGNAAGPIRNGQMLLKLKEVAKTLGEDTEIGVIAFPGGKGTANMIEQARIAQVNVDQIKVEDGKATITQRREEPEQDIVQEDAEFIVVKSS